MKSDYQALKNDKLHLPISSDDKNILKERAKKCRMPLAVYCIFVLMNTQPKLESEK